MAIDLDALVLLRAIGAHPDRFAPIGADARQLALRLLTRHLRHHGADPAGWRDLHAVLGRSGLALFLDALPEPELRAFARRVDRHNGAIDAWSSERIRRHLGEIGEGTDPLPDPRPRQRSTERVASVFSPAFTAVWTGKDEADRS